MGLTSFVKQSDQKTDQFDIHRSFMHEEANQSKSPLNGAKAKPSYQAPTISSHHQQKKSKHSIRSISSLISNQIPLMSPAARVAD